MKNNPFQKLPLSIEEQLRLLSSRGLIIQDKEAARAYLKFISYYRFCNYGIEFQNSIDNEEKCYYPGTTFEQILDCYVFDRKLRLLVIDAIERIEVALRTVISNELALIHGAHWYLNSALFLKNFRHEELVQSIKKETLQHKRREYFIQQYFDKYAYPELPAIWIVAEILSLGTWSIIFANLKNRKDQKLICKHFELNYVLMISWLHSITYLRNLCAHHSKLWNRVFTLKPKVASNYCSYLKDNATFFAQAVILKIFLDTISPCSRCSQHLYELIKKHPQIDITKMGFQQDWYSQSFWNIVL